MIILLHRIHDPLAGSEVHHALAGDCERRRTTLSCMFAFGLDRDLLHAEDIQFTKGIRLLINLPALGGWRDRIEYATFRDARLHMLRDELIAITGDSYAWVFRLDAVGN